MKARQAALELLSVLVFVLHGQRSLFKFLSRRGLRERVS